MPFKCLHGRLSPDTALGAISIPQHVRSPAMPQHLSSERSVPTFPTLPSSSGLLVKSGGGWTGMTPGFSADEDSLSPAEEEAAGVFCSSGDLLSLQEWQETPWNLLMSAGCLPSALAEQCGFGASFLATLALLSSPRLFPFPSPRTMRCCDWAQPVRGSQAERPVCPAQVGFPSTAIVFPG